MLGINLCIYLFRVANIFCDKHALNVEIYEHYLMGETIVGVKKSRGKIKSGKKLVTCKNLVTFPLVKILVGEKEIEEKFGRGKF